MQIHRQPAAERMMDMEMDPSHSALDTILGCLQPEDRDFIMALIDKDPLTGIYNRRKFDTDLELVVSISKRTAKGTSLLMIDIDDFKAFNDRHGHQVGDQVLRSVTQTLEKSLRDYDKTHLYRYGGEEFVVLLPDVTQEEAFNIGSRIRKKVAEETSVTISAGISHFSETSTDLESLIRNADKALYAAKRKGKDRVEIYTESSKDQDRV